MLRVKPTASFEEIRAAYIAILRACHPDLNGSGPEPLLNDLTVLINAAYAVLSDAAQREEYDGEHGFATSGPSPFEPASDLRYPAEQIFVDEAHCIGCRVCADLKPETFVMNERGRAAALEDPCGDAGPDLGEVIALCPTHCIHRVTAPQLALLRQETAETMSKLRPVHSLRSNPASSGPDVFTRARVRWEKRRNEAEARAEAQDQAERLRATGYGAWGGLGSFLWAAVQANVSTQQGAAATGAGSDSAAGQEAAATGQGRRSAASTRLSGGDMRRRYRALRRRLKEKQRTSIRGLLPAQSSAGEDKH